jgi:hypothetical protein
VIVRTVIVRTVIVRNVLLRTLILTDIGGQDPQMSVRIKDLGASASGLPLVAVLSAASGDERACPSPVLALVSVAAPPAGQVTGGGPGRRLDPVVQAVGHLVRGALHQLGRLRLHRSRGMLHWRTVRRGAGELLHLLVALAPGARADDEAGGHAAEERNSIPMHLNLSRASRPARAGSRRPGTPR